MRLFVRLTRLQPADTLLSQINKGHGPQGSMVYRLTTLAREAGFRGLFAGLGPRMIMTAGLVASQFLMYGEIKRGTHTDGVSDVLFIHAYSPARSSGARDPQGGLILHVLQCIISVSPSRHSSRTRVQLFILHSHPHLSAPAPQPGGP
jgi:hypothetical protein